jgi:hypothetical protein
MPLGDVDGGVGAAREGVTGPAPRDHVTPNCDEAVDHGASEQLVRFPMLR